MGTGGTHDYDVIVIGAGHNGLTAAALLAKRGRKVLVLERRNVVGGLAVGDEFHPGYRSAGMIHDASCVSADVVDALKLERFGLSFCDAPPMFAPQIDGPGLLLHRAPGDSFAEISRHSRRDAERYREFRAFLARLTKFTSRLFHEPPPDASGEGICGLMSLASSGLALRRLGRRDMLEFLRIAPMCVADWLGEWFENELLKSVLAYPAIAHSFTGPWSPGTNAVLVRHESLVGRCVRGGSATVIDALGAAARSYGADIRTSAEVARIGVDGGSVTGVTLADGMAIDASSVAASCDPKRTLLHLVRGQETSANLEHRVEAYRTSGTTAKVDLALNGPLRFSCRPELVCEHVRIVSTLDDMERAFDPVKYGRFSDRPILDIYDPTVCHADWAPQGHRVASIVFHFAPHDLTGGWTEEARERLGDAAIETLSRHAPDVCDRIVSRRVMSPVDIERVFGATGGHVYHGEHGLDQLIVRPAPECARYATPIDGLYLCGSGSHPGGGLTCLPGVLAARHILGAVGAYA